MNTLVWSHTLYAVIGVGITCWVARTLRRHGSTFASAGDQYDGETGPAMTHLLVVGFCLISFGIVSLALSLGSPGVTLQSCIETLSSKLGWVILSIGGLHFVMLLLFASMGRRRSHVPVPAPGVGKTPPGSERNVAQILARSPWNHAE